MSNGITQRQHYVPQSYLKNFYKPNSEQVAVFDLTTSKKFSTDTINIAQERFFYDLPPKLEKEFGVVQFMEKFFHPSESNGKEIRDKIIIEAASNPRINLTEKERFLLSNYIVLQYFRTKEFRNYYVEITEKTYEHVAKLQLTLVDPELLKEPFRIKFNEVHLPVHQARFLLDVGNILDISLRLSNHGWLILKNDTKIPFITSDNPVFLIPHKQDMLLSHSGLLSEGIELIYPISPGFILIIFDSSFFKKFNSSDIIVSDINDAYVISYYNSAQLISSSRQLYSNSDNWEHIQQILIQNPNFIQTLDDRILIEQIKTPEGREFMHIRNNLNRYRKLIGKSFLN
ncbi:DUF4238 domain-containing protein [Leptospira noguchii]|uniref:PF14022 family protein n=1 Tax=Leptospira noguchii serovar Autumnalis str. ZUN142 TaxID=1085540 RepID=M6UV97_9LEPT|nr:DUF4238 domain-containing protein [Leptospira noguchii]EMO41223.1 PF14022 family protein [Leptospira noguchii serovar Autumnalis str. ZUN142]UOG49297.1 DUF4238 domain-containing protein [Leptospira noguchii]